MLLKIFLVLAGIFLVFFILLAIIPLRFHLYYHKKDRDDEFIIEIQPPKNIFYQKIAIPAVKLRDNWRKLVLDWEGTLGNEQEFFLEGEQGIDLVDLMEDFQLVVATVRRVTEHALACGHMARYTRLQHFEFILLIGTGNPAYTGMVAGVLWSVIPTLSSRVFNYIKNVEKHPVIKVNPDFVKRNFALSFDSIFTLKIGHIMTIGSCILLQELKHYFRRKRKLGKKE